MHKTNAMRMLDKRHIPYACIAYEVDENDLSGMNIAMKTGLDAQTMFKTLVLQADHNSCIVCAIPVNSELDLKKVAKASGQKRVEMLPLTLLLKQSGYIRGGCSPMGMKKVYPTYFDETMLLFDEIYINAGMRGMMLKISSENIIEFCHANVVDLCK